MKKLVVFFALIVINVNAATINWNLASIYGVTQSGFQSIISDARTHFQNSPNDIIIVKIPSGTFNIGGNGSHGINLGNGLTPGINGRLIFQGNGKNNTKLIFTDLETNMIYGTNSKRISFIGMHFARAIRTATQGNVVSKKRGEIVIEINRGYPTPLELFNYTFGQGRYLRKYTNSTTDPLLLQNNNDQVAWGTRNNVNKLPVLVSGRKWKIFLNRRNQNLNNYNIGDLVGIKSKIAGEIYWISKCDDILFSDIRFTGSSRGLTRGGTSNFVIKNCEIVKEAPLFGQAACMSTSSGGFQMNQDGDAVSTNMVVENCFIDSVGDDGVAFFHVNGGIVKNTTIRNSFARGLLATVKASNICNNNNTIFNNIIKDEGNAISNCTTFNKNIAPQITQRNLSDISFEEAKFKIYPNPVFKDLVINTELEIKSVQIYSIEGKLIFNTINLNKKTINLEFLEKGTYFLRATFEDNTEIQEKFVKK